MSTDGLLIGAAIPAIDRVPSAAVLTSIGWADTLKLRVSFFDLAIVEVIPCFAFGDVAGRLCVRQRQVMAN
jgi:hypothetical protein